MGGSGNGLHLSGIALAVIVLAAWMLQSPPLAPSRPGHGDQLRDRGNNVEDVPARLWQDPFEAVQRFRDKQREQRTKRAATASTLVDGVAVTVRLAPPGQPDDPHTLPQLAQYVAQELGSKPLTVLPVMAFTAPYAEDAERRLRLRTAVIAGLGANRLYPRDGKHIGYWQYDDDPQVGTSRYAVIPYELYKGDAQGVLVLWLPTERFSRQPVRRLGELLGTLRAALQGTHRGQSQADRYIVLGPPDSDTLKAMAADAPKVGEVAALKGVEMFSAAATAPASSLLPAAAQRDCKHKYAANQFVPRDQCLEEQLQDDMREAGITLVRSIVTDEHIARALVNELALRGVDLACTSERGFPRPPCFHHQVDKTYWGYRDHVVLISETDTSFGRSLPRLFNAEVIRRIPEHRPLPDDLRDNDQETTAPWIHRYGYLRGVDGELPNTKPAEKDIKPARLQALSVLDPGGLEPATGTSQFDYLRRLATHIRELDRHLRNTRQGRIRAIGVLGTDVYDKLLILQAMREHFPNHVYFTNDLDARFLDPKEYRWTRNLVVASAFGLELAPRWQRLVPPFRGVYQTSTFLSTHLALQGDPKLSRSEQLRQQLMPRIFEIGHNRAFDLRPDRAEGEKPTSGADAQTSIFYPRPHAAPDVPPQTIWVVIIAPFALMLLTLAISPLRRWLIVRHQASALSCPLGFAAVSLVVLGGTYWWMTLQLEPFVWTAGVSMWPSELIRVACFLFSLVFLTTAVGRVYREENEIARRFKLSDRDADSRLPWCQALWSRIRNDGWACLRHPSRYCTREHLRAALDMFEWYDEPIQEKPGEKKQIKSVWDVYSGHARISHRFARAVLMFLLLWIIAWIALIFVQPMQVPYRGDHAYYFSFWFGMVPLAIAFGLLLFWVMDEARLCSALVRHVSHSQQDWPGVAQDAEDELSRSWDIDAGGAEQPPDEQTRRALLANRIRLESKRRTVEFIAQRTAPAGDIIWYPFVALILILLSLSTRFDNYDTKTAVLSLLGASIAIALSSAYLLRRTATHAKQQIVDQLRSDLLSQRSIEAKSAPDQIEVLIRQIEEIHHGAFRPWYQEPLVRALAWVGSMGAVIIFEYLTVSG